MKLSKIIRHLENGGEVKHIRSGQVLKDLELITWSWIEKLMTNHNDFELINPPKWWVLWKK